MASDTEWEFPSVVSYFDEDQQTIYRLSRILSALPDAEAATARAHVTRGVERCTDNMDDLTLRNAAVTFINDLYKAANAVPLWDNAIRALSRGSSPTILRRAPQAWL